MQQRQAFNGRHGLANRDYASMVDLRQISQMQQSGSHPPVFYNRYNEAPLLAYGNNGMGSKNFSTDGLDKLDGPRRLSNRNEFSNLSLIFDFFFQEPTTFSHAPTNLTAAQMEHARLSKKWRSQDSGIGKN